MAPDLLSLAADPTYTGAPESNAYYEGTDNYSVALGGINERWHEKNQKDALNALGKIFGGGSFGDYSVFSFENYNQLEELYPHALSHALDTGFPSPSLRIQENQENNAHVPSGAQIEIANLFNNLKRDWVLSNTQMASLLGLDNISGEQYVENLLAKRCSFDGRDVKYRMARLIEIREILFALFRNHEIENLWLRGKQKTLGNKAPMDLMLEGTMANFLRAEGFIKETAGR